VRRGETVLREGQLISRQSCIERIINGGDRVAVIGRAHGIIKDTGGPFDVPIMHLWAFNDGLAGHLEIVLDVLVMQAALRR
jgi:ketosteroid isomerase-like protein